MYRATVQLVIGIGVGELNVAGGQTRELLENQTQTREPVMLSEMHDC